MKDLTFDGSDRVETISDEDFIYVEKFEWFLNRETDQVQTTLNGKPVTLNLFLKSVIPWLKERDFLTAFHELCKDIKLKPNWKLFATVDESGFLQIIIRSDGFDSAEEAAHEYDEMARRMGIPESELNFPRRRK